MRVCCRDNGCQSVIGNVTAVILSPATEALILLGSKVSVVMAAFLLYSIGIII